MAGNLLFLLKSKTPLLPPGLLSQGIVIGSNAIGITYFLKHSLLLKKYRKYTERSGAYGPDEPAEELNGMLNDIISNDLKEKTSENTPVALYLTSGMETSHLGTVGTLSGAFVGVPKFYEFKNEEDVKENYLIKYANNVTESDQEKELIDCFILSNDAKKYGIAREVLLVNSLQVYINGILPFAVSMATFSLYKEVYEVILKKPLYMRSLIYIAATLAGLSLWRFLYRNILLYYESEVEASIAELGSDYIKGGIEYCSKRLQQSALSVETKDVKTSAFKVVDDVICKILPQGITLSKRLEYLKALEQNSKSLQQ